VVQLYRLDEYFKKKKIQNKLRLIKIDVEGAEFEVLSGAKKTLKKHKPTVLVEIYCKDLQHVKKRDRLFDYMESLGYVSYMLTPKGPRKTSYRNISHDTINIILKHHG